MKFSLLYFVRLFLRHGVLLILVPLTLAASVFFLTKNEPRTYISRTTVYTSLATGSSVDLSGFTFNTVSTQFDNLMSIIKSNATLQKTGLSLFASHLLLDRPDPMVIDPKHYEEIMKTVPQEVKNLAVKGDFDQTLANLQQYFDASTTNFVYNLINNSTTYYNPSTILSKLTVRRIQNSDNIELSYQSDDPGICRQTLLFLIQVYKEAYIVQKAGQSENAVAYFEAEVAKASERLKDAENELLEFNKANKIINYNEQSKFIAGRKEQFEMGYQEVLKQNSSSKAVIDMLEKKMTPGIKRSLASTQMLGLRKELSRVNQDLAAMQSLANEEDNSSANRAKFRSLNQKSFELKDQMRNVVDSLYDLTNGTTNVPERNIVTDWLSSIIDYEGTMAQIGTMDKLRSEFDVIYSQYAPMGAMMRRLERKIAIAEDEYLSLVKNLGLARLKQQSVEVSSANTILDPPRYPLQPQPGKQKILILAAAVIGLLVTMLIILALDLLDNTLRNAAKAAGAIGLDVESIFPVIRKRRQKVDIGYLERKSIEAISRKLILQSLTSKGEKGPVISIAFSTLENEGKSFLLQRVAAHLSGIGYRVLLLYPQSSPMTESAGYDMTHYAISKDFYLIRGLRGLDTPDFTPDWENYHFIFVEFPGILNSSFPVNLFKTADHCFLVCRANRSWSKADANILADVLAVTDPVKPKVLLNGVALEEMESLVGELPRKRSKLRIAVKKILTRQFNW